jgi:hypothetical protein
MLPLSPPDEIGLDYQDETVMAEDLADLFDEYVSNELVDTLFEMAKEVIERNTGMEPSDPEVLHLALDLIRRIKVIATK